MQISHKDGWEQLAILREAVTKVTGALHEAQILQLKYWIYIADPSIVSHEVTWNIDKKTIVYDCEADTEAMASDHHGFKALDHSIKLMLGDEWSTTVNINGETIYAGKSKTPTKHKSAKAKGKRARKR